MAAEPWLLLLQAAPPGSRRWLELVRSHGAGPAAERTLAELEAAGIPANQANRLRAPQDAMLQTWRDWLSSPQNHLVPIDDPAYPELLKEISDPPLALWVRGERVELLKSPQLAVVGSRNPTRGGRDTASRFARYLSDHGLTITSGLACGIDGAGHEGALSGAAGTIAVLGCGPDIVYPREHADLAERVTAKGLLVSEYPPGTQARAANFPRRNRIIAGLSVGTLVVEAARRSGSLITARLAAEYGREVFAIPGSIHNPMAKGCHALIKQGAKLVEEAADILVELAPLLRLELDLGVEAPQNANGASGDVLTEQPGYAELLDAMGYDPCNLAELADCAGLTTAELSSMLLILELEGLVEALPGGRYARLPKRIS
ncbi:MAG TPA: DNA-processing protein DprA [Gammaproteobacteria bacterium]|jgi:DNA processing protein